jgi:CRISPR type III-B/RAMP module-associated protein Cmr5
MPVWMLERERARDAWDRVRSVATLDTDLQKRYRSVVRGASAMVQRNGLGQFLAFLASKGFDGGQLLPERNDKGRINRERADGLLFQHLGRWLVQILRILPNPPPLDQVLPTGEDATFDPLYWLLGDHRGLDDTMRATREVLAWLQWARRFTESQLQQPDSQDDAK